MKVKVNLHSIVEAWEVFHLGAEDEVSKLSKGQEDDEEHYSKSCQILCTTSQGRAELGHCLIEANVLEYLWITDKKVNDPFKYHDKMTRENCET